MISSSTTKSTSNWLDRLRSSRGFPTGEEPGLDRFLSTSSSGSAPTTESTQCLKSGTSGRQNDEQWVGEVSNVLCELFNMGESSRTFSKKKKKNTRKQTNPRICSNENELCSSDDLRREKSENGLASSGDNSLTERRENINVDVDVEERENVDDLKAYSRSEVMVIDTSLPEWKFDGWIFRKKSKNDDEWKIKEKKSRSRVFGGKKRKLVLSTLNDEKLDKDEMKKMKKKDDESFLLLNKGQSQNYRKEEPFKEEVDLLGKVPQKRFPCPRPPNQLGNEGSSVVLLKSIPLNNSNVPPNQLGNEGSSVILLKSIPLNNSNVAIKLGKSALKKRPKKMKIV